MNLIDQAAMHYANSQSCYAASLQVLEDARAAGLLVKTGEHTWDTAPDADRGAACTAWNRSVELRRRARKEQIESSKCKGRAYWEQRGIAVGSKVYAVARHMLNPLGALRVDGIAKVGACGAYVQSRYQRGRLDPDAFRA